MNRTVGFVVVAFVVVLAGCSGGITDGDGSATPSDVEVAGGGEDVPETLTFQPADRLEVRVTAVVDGDTVDVRLPNGSTETVRLVGIDTPEVHVENDPAEFEGVPDTDAGRSCLREAGTDASAAATSRLDGETVTLLVDPNTDRRGGYGRLLAYVMQNGTNVNHALVAEGHARVFDTSFALRDSFDSAESDARTAGRGLWRCQQPS